MKRTFVGVGIVGVALLLLVLMPGSPQEPVPVPKYVIRRVVPQRPAMEGAFSPDGTRFVFVHQDRLWLAEGERIRRIGAPAVDQVYRARWAADSLIVVSQVLPGSGDALGLLDLAAGRYRRFASRVYEDGFDTSRSGGLVVWRRASSRPPHAPPMLEGHGGGGASEDAWMAVLGAGPPGPVRLASGACAGLAVPSPDGRRVAGLAYGEKPCLHLAPSGGAVALAADPEDVPVAAAWSSDGSAVAYLMSAGGSAQGRQTLVVYPVNERDRVLRRKLPRACAAIAWDAESAGVFCQVGGDDPGLWYASCTTGEEPRRVYAGPLSQFAPLAGGHALAVTAADDKPGLHRLYILNTAGTLARPVTNTPSFDHLDDVSADHRKVLVTRRPRDDRQALLPEATLWIFDLVGK